jgi:hypothetical protein
MVLDKISDRIIGMVKARKTRRRQRGGGVGAARGASDLFKKEVAKLLAVAKKYSDNIQTIQDGNDPRQMAEKINEAINILLKQNPVANKVILDTYADPVTDDIAITNDQGNINNDTDAQKDIINELNTARKLKESANNLYNTLLKIIKLRVDAGQESVEPEEVQLTRPTGSNTEFFSRNTNLSPLGRNERGYEDPSAPSMPIRVRQQPSLVRKPESGFNPNAYKPGGNPLGITRGELSNPNGSSRTRRRLLRKKN